MGEGNPPFPKSPPITISHVRSFLPSFPPYFIALYVGEQVRRMGEGGRGGRLCTHAAAAAYVSHIGTKFASCDRSLLAPSQLRLSLTEFPHKNIRTK